MSAEPAVPARRQYRSPRRLEQAAQTRATVLAAAGRLFGEQGWAATGMRDVARAAGVSVETVYANVGSKSDLLVAAFDAAIVGDAEPVALAERAEFTAIGRGSRRERVRVAARLMAEIHQRTAGMHLALREAAASDRELADRLRGTELRRRISVGQALALIAGGAVPDDVCDGLWAVCGVDLYRQLTELRGWTAQQYETWLADAVDRLLPDSGTDD